MTEKETKKKTTKQPKKVVQVEKKEALFELVNNADIKNDALMAGILVKAGLYEQYLQELTDCHSYVIKPTMTKTDFNKILKKYKG